MKRRPGGRWRQLAHGERGAVSVYFIIITAGIFLFHAVMIDYARLAAMNHKLESAARVGVRSVMSAYDDQLYARYGLFARGGTPSDDIFKASLAGSLGDAGDELFHLLDLQLGEAHVNSAGAIGYHPIFRSQVMEEMKYKAPIDFTIEMVNRFRPMSGALQEATATVDLLEQLQKLYESRERVLADALGLQRTMAQQAKDSDLPELIPHGQSPSAAMKPSTAAGVAAGHGEYVGWIESDRLREEGELPQHTGQIARYRSAARLTASGLSKAGRETAARHETLSRQATAKIAQAAAINEQMRTIVKQSRSAPPPSGYGELPSDASGGATQGGTDELKAIRDKVDELLLEPQWFNAFENDVRRQLSAAQAISGAAAEFQAAVSSALGSTAQSSRLNGAFADLENTYADYHRKYVMPGSVIQDRVLELQQMGADEERKQQKKEAEAKLGDAKRMLSRISGLQQTEEQIAAFERLEALYASNKAANEAASGAAEAAQSGTAALGDDPTGEAKRSLIGTGGIFGGLGSMLEGVPERLYLNEYAVDRFVSFNPQRLLEAVQGGATELAADALEVNQQELEYILYGFHAPTANVAAAFGEIFALRLSIRTMEGLVKNSKLGHPLVVLGAAVIHGLVTATADMLKLVLDGKTELSDMLKVDVYYVDYLRLFLLMHGSTAQKMSRMIALIEYSTGYRLLAMDAAVTAEATGSVKLWFLPGAMRMLSAGRILEGKVVGGRYETTKKIGWSY
ncbi:hypothetical protein IDH44_03905 [Paenibacillus sp. IB182496]|uniref:Uncharacterized protein n=1 Tax=Paenibacillus sabuli TaxID=2772509 RepID=A0A927GQF3_9BACL|nr:hypothetical protein [Paenibacillus sabuli]MBD2844323.1 hypothetical protein [Paenibacillus sabuli]